MAPLEGGAKFVGVRTEGRRAPHYFFLPFLPPAFLAGAFFAGAFFAGAFLAGLDAFFGAAFALFLRFEPPT